VSAEILQFLPMFSEPNRIRELRRARDWSQQHLADLVGVSKVTISDLELGKMQLTVDYMRRLAIALTVPGSRVSPADLLTVDDNPYLPRDDNERALVSDYRSADEIQREIIRRVAKPAGREDRAA
jgi:transcriptional regulator with XRE-family HTH domain